MSPVTRRYHHCGPRDLLEVEAAGTGVVQVRTPVVLAAWLDQRRADELARNIVHDDDFVCAICGSELAQAWNFGSV
jgi:hypothetical protein